MQTDGGAAISLLSLISRGKGSAGLRECEACRWVCVCSHILTDDVILWQKHESKCPAVDSSEGTPPSPVRMGGEEALRERVGTSSAVYKVP